MGIDMKMFQIQGRMRKGELYWVAGGILGAYLLGVGVWSAISAGDDGMVRAFPLGTLIAVVSTTVAHFIGCTCAMLKAFELSVSMGATRKQFVGSYVAFGLSELAFACVFIRVLYGLEKTFYLKMFDLPTYETAVISAGDWLLWAVGLIAVLLSAELFMGALLLKFGAKAFAVIWLAIMTACYLPRWLLRMDGRKESVFGGRLGDMVQAAAPAIPVVTVFVCVIMVLAAWGMLRRQQVNG